jgi:hypothetical protein
MTFEEFEAQVTSVKGDPHLDPAARLLYESNAIGGEAAEVFEAVTGLLLASGRLQSFPPTWHFAGSQSSRAPWRCP